MERLEADEVLAYLQQMLRRYRFLGGTLDISREDAGEYERAIAWARYESEQLDERVAAKVYGFGQVTQDDVVDGR